MAMAGGSCFEYHADDHHRTMVMIIVIIVMMVMIDDHYGNVKSQAGMVWSGSSSVFCGATVIRFSIFCFLFEPNI